MVKCLCRLNYLGYNFNCRYYTNEKGEVFIAVNSKNGRVKKHQRIKSFINKYGYIEYVLLDKYKKRQHIQAHRIVAGIFLKKLYSEKRWQVNHIDGNKTNNKISNLEWVTPSENEKHSYKQLGKQSWNKNKKLPSLYKYRGKIRKVAQYDIYGNLIKIWFNPKEAEIVGGFNVKQISAVCNKRQKTHKGYVWSYVEQ